MTGKIPERPIRVEVSAAELRMLEAIRSGEAPMVPLLDPPAVGVPPLSKRAAMPNFVRLATNEYFADNVRAGTNMNINFNNICTFIRQRPMTAAVFALGIVFFLSACTLFYFSASMKDVTIAHYKMPVTVMAGIWFLSWSINFFMETKKHMQRSFLEQHIKILTEQLEADREAVRTLIPELVSVQTAFEHMVQPPQNLVAEIKALESSRAKLLAQLEGPLRDQMEVTQDLLKEVMNLCKLLVEKWMRFLKNLACQF